MEKVSVNAFVTRQIKGSGKTYSSSLTFEEIAKDAENQMKKEAFRDGLDMVKEGKIDPSSVIDCVINKNGPSIREIIIKNYRQKERLDEIINTATWSLTRMLENSIK